MDVYYDNQSAILLENNGRASSSKRTRHINIRYYFVKDKIDSGEIKIEYCPTKQMMADFFTKPLQGSPFLTFRNFIMNTTNSILDVSLLDDEQSDMIPSTNSSVDHRSVLENSVTGNKRNLEKCDSEEKRPYASKI